MKLENIKIIMVGTTHPGNIGAAARAMNNMCFSKLVLVDPQCKIGEIAYARASGANTILDERRVVSSLELAVADCQIIIAASARRRSLAWPELSPPQMAQKLVEMEDQKQAALVFGREQSGLSNEELQLCNYMLSIPTNPQFTSLNVAAAIQIACYEVYRHFCSGQELEAADAEEPAASSAEVEGYFQHLQQVLESTCFLNPENPGLIMQRLRRLYLRTEVSKNEVNILRGMLSAVEKYKS